MNELSESISGVPLVGTSLFNGLACCPSFPATQWCDSICYWSVRDTAKVEKVNPISPGGKLLCRIIDLRLPPRVLMLHLKQSM